eukprot:m51a1_g6318 putative acyltransferase 3 (189) ;mRNA; r:348561-349291
MLDPQEPAHDVELHVACRNEDSGPLVATQPPDDQQQQRQQRQPRQRDDLDDGEAPADAGSAGEQQRQRRADIQALRAVAVAAVVLFHAGFRWARGGFVGVDVFFVISGFLVFGSVIKSLEQGKFSLLDFVCRRAKRLQPPSIVMLTVLVAFLWHSAMCDTEGCGKRFRDIFWASLQIANFRYLTMKQG